MKKILLFLLFLAIAVPAQAATYYIRTGGGTSTQCLGTTNADYSGSGTGQACAFSHPAWALGAVGTSGVMAGGDTLIISNESYMIGYGMPNTAGCISSAQPDCILDSPPSGTVSSPTKIYGTSYATGCASKPELWGTRGASGVINVLLRSNIEIQCIELTDHSACGELTGQTICSKDASGNPTGTWARTGLRGVSDTNLTLKNIDIHGFARQGILLGELSGVTNLDHVNSDGNTMNGWEGDLTSKGVGTNTGSIQNGTMNWNYVNIRYNGCKEAYPRSSSFSAGDYTNCTDQSQSNDGLGSNVTGGNWNIVNSSVSHNMSDGIDLRYCDNCGTINVDKSLFEGNEGTGLKIETTNMNLTNSILIGNCNYMSAAGKVYVQSEPCRAGGVPLAIWVQVGGTYKITNTSLYSATDSDSSAVLEVSKNKKVPNGTETYTFKNNIFVQYQNASNSHWTPYYNVSLTGAALTALQAATTDHSVIYNFSSNPSGTGNTYTAPAWTSSISLGAATNVDKIPLTSNVGGGTSTTYWNDSKDYNKYPQNASIDKGALQYGSSSQLQQNGQSCIAASDCSSGTCTAFVCSGSCTANGGACATGATCCSGTCTALVCAVPATCGDGTVQTAAGEVCDTSGPNLNGSNCILQGHTGGTLGCTAGCASFDTSGCTDTLVFPLTPILDNFNRSNEGPPPSSSWTTINGSLTTVSNTCKGTLSGSTHNRAYWNANIFNVDQEVYGTITGKGGTTADAINFYLRFDPVALNGYYVQYLENTAGTDSVIFKKITGGTASTIHTYSQEVSAGDSIGLSAIGSTLTVYYKASAGSWTALGNDTDTTYSGTGTVAADIAYNTTSPIFDNFGGGAINPVVCGNDLIESGEICDDQDANGIDLGGQSCTSLGYASGTLACLPNCTAFDTTSCTSLAVCGNNTTENGEICDGTDLDSNTCATIGGYISGSLTCSSDCLSFITTGCISSPGGATGVILK